MIKSMTISDSQFEPEAGLSLPEDEVHLWQIDLEAVATAESRWRTVLSADENARADRFHFAPGRQSFAATRAVLRILLGGYIGCNPGALGFLSGEKDKPSLDPAHGAAGLQFNVSHSGSRALLAFARGREVGVDIEQIRDALDHDTLARRFFSVAEQKSLAALPPSERCKGFFRCWTRKEAYIKARGDGLFLQLSSFDVSLFPGEQDALLATRPESGEARLWSLREVDAGPGYEAALCVRGHGWTLKS